MSTCRRSCTTSSPTPTPTRRRWSSSPERLKKRSSRTWKSCSQVAVNAAFGGVVRRREDPRLITGAGLYTDDVRLDRCLHAVFVRSSIAHARIRSVDVALASAMPGVVGIFGAKDFEFESMTARPRLASEMVLFVGDAIAVAVAETRDQAVDAAAAVVVDYDPLPAVVDSIKALEPDADLVQPDRDDNLVIDFEVGEAGGVGGGAVALKARFINQRPAAGPLATHAGVAGAPRGGGNRSLCSAPIPFPSRP